MPVRKRKSKARASDVEAWSTYMYSGFDFFDQLSAIGLTEETAEPLAETVWRNIGDQIFAYYDDLYRGSIPPERPFWAETQFGPPAGSRRLRR